MYKQIASLLDVVEHPLNRKDKIKTLFRILWWKFNQYFLNIPAVVEIQDNVKCICYPDSSYSGLVVYKKLPEYYEMKYIANILENNDRFIDIGANIGAISLIAASRIGKKGRVYAFEPDINVLPRLRENVCLNDYKNIEIFNKAVSDSVSRIKFVNEGLSEVSHLAYSDNETVSVDSVKSVTLDDFVLTRKIKKIKMLKVDVEGAEMKVLLGAKKALSRTSYLLIEMNKNSLKYGYTFDQALNFIRRSRFDVFMFSDSGKLVKISKCPDFDKSINVLAINSRLK